MPDRILQITDSIISLYRKYGDELYFGEGVTQLQHAIQAANLAKDSGSDEETILAAFLHDIGHLCIDESEEHHVMDSYGVVDHETLGANFLSKMGFSNKVCGLIASHVNAKRYLTYMHPEYYDQLSEASKHTLEFQGGKMTEDEAKHFQEDIHFECYIQLRKWDEMAKSEIPLDENLDYISQLIKAHLLERSENTTS
jgi:phosphonate degradation associated HDIG domain protein